MRQKTLGLILIEHSIRVALFATLTFGTCSSQETSELNTFKPVVKIDGIDRLEHVDIMILMSGEKLRGHILNKQLSLHTAYGTIPFKTEWLAGIAMDQTPWHADEIKTVNKNRFTGYLNDTITFQEESGETIQHNKESIARMVFRHRTDESNRTTQGRFIVLDNGDFFSGHLSDWEPKVKMGHGRELIPIKDMELVHLINESDKMRLLLRNGKEVIAPLDTDTLKLELEMGPVVNLRITQIQTIFLQTETLPISVRQAFPHTGMNLEAEFKLPPAAPPKGMVWIPPGRFQLGSSLNEKGRDTDEDPPTDVHLTKGFWKGIHEVTQGEYLKLQGTNPSGYPGPPNLPVEKVTWNEAVAYCRKLTEHERSSAHLPPGFVYRLPTEAEWEYACRSGSITRFHFGEDQRETELADFAWYTENSQSATHAVGQLQPNAWGLYDMHGNVWEWCQDVWQDAYTGGTVIDYSGPTEGWLRVARGGSWLYSANYCRSANRDSYGPNNRCSDIGFRVVLAANR